MPQLLKLLSRSPAEHRQPGGARAGGRPPPWRKETHQELTKEAALEALTTFLEGDQHGHFTGQVQQAIREQQPQGVARTEEQALQSALAALGYRKARFEQAVEDVADAREWLAQLVDQQNLAALDLVKAQTVEGSFPRQEDKDLLERSHRLE